MSGRWPPRPGGGCWRTTRSWPDKLCASLGLAYKDLPAGYRDEDLAGGLVFVGLVGMIDPLREEAKAAIETCRLAGIPA